MPTGETVAVKVLASDSKQGEKEFQTEVLGGWHMGYYRHLYVKQFFTPYHIATGAFACKTASSEPCELSWLLC